MAFTKSYLKMQDNLDPRTANSESWLDITNEYMQSVAKLNLGELIKPDNFTLLEAMSAIELMDPKIDSGLLLRKSDREILSLDQSIKLGKIKINDLQLDELLGIIDDTYACMTTWFDGHSLFQTVMTNLYLHDIEKIEDRCLRIFCQAALKIVDIIDRMVGAAHCFEEEDFMLSNGKFKLANHLNDQRVLTSLEDLCIHYENLYFDSQKYGPSGQQTKNAKPVNHSPRQPTENSPTFISDKHLPTDQTKLEQLSALIVRLRFTNNFYACLLNVSKNLLNEFPVNEPNMQARAQKTIKQVQSSTSICDHNLEVCLRQLDKWADTLDLGIRATADRKTSSNSNGDYPTIVGFDPFINFKLLPAAYPRIPYIRSRPEALEYLKTTIIRMRRCITISSQFNQSKSFIKQFEAAEQFSKHFELGSCVISRSFLQMLYLPNRINSMLKEEILQSMTEYCEPIVQLLKADDHRFSALDEFLSESTRLFHQIVTSYGHNPARQYEALSNDIIQSFRNLQYSAYLLSDTINSTMVYSWTTYYYMKFCIKYVLSGLELELFSPHEYPYVFWYIFGILLSNEREQLEIAKRLIVTTCEKTMNNDILGNNNRQANKLTRTKVKKRLSKLDNMIEVFHDKHLLLNEALCNLTHGLFLLTTGLKKQGLIRVPSFEFTNEKICFDNRFGLITGGASVYHSYQQANLYISTETSCKSIYIDASKRLSRAKELFERCGDQEECAAVSKANNIVATILYTNPDAFANRRVEFCFDKHSSLPIVKL